jgi:hypothetical protein
MVNRLQGHEATCTGELHPLSVDPTE